ncbi:MAG: DEAD/DEAH box helicase [Candidatus Cloacimonetes bacterium]|nr:DEAD/DEAH box helicase [Candidatus Cloacimonadota bacterium]
MNSIEITITKKVFTSIQALQNALTSDQLESFLEDVANDLTFDNPAYESAVRFSKSRFVKVPKNLSYLEVRKPKTNPTLEVPLGYLEDYVNKLKDFQIKVSVDNLLVSNPREFQSLIELKPYQEVAVQSMLKRHRGLLIAPCGSGKTIMSIALIAKRQQKTLILVHTLDLLNQWNDRIKTFLGVKASLIGKGSKQTEGDIIIATVQTLVRDKKLLMQLESEIGTLIVDECHHTPASTFSKVVSNLRPLYLYGCSATPNREDGLSFIMHLYLGKTLHQIHSQTLQKSQLLLKPSLHKIATDFFYPYDSEDQESYGKMMDSLINCDQRNELIVQKLEKTSDNINLILSQRVAHCLTLQKMLQDKLPNHRIEVLTGSVSKVQREQIINDAREKKVSYLIATQLADEGLDIPCLENLWLVTPSRNTSRIEQRVGRVMRLAKDKSDPKVFDFIDSKTKVLLSQYKTRLHKVYKKILK